MLDWYGSRGAEAGIGAGTSPSGAGLRSSSDFSGAGISTSAVPLSGFDRLLDSDVLLRFIQYLYDSVNGLVRLLKIAGERELLKEKFEIIRVY